MDEFEGYADEIGRRLIHAPCPQCGRPSEFRDALPVPVDTLKFLYRKEFPHSELPEHHHPTALACLHECRNGQCEVDEWGQFVFHAEPEPEQEPQQDEAPEPEPEPEPDPEPEGKHSIDDLLSLINPN